jgi:hypothetical protein
LTDGLAVIICFSSLRHKKRKLLSAVHDVSFMVILSVFVSFCGPPVHLIGFINFASVFIQIANIVYCVESRRVLRSQRLFLRFQRLLIHLLRLIQLALIKVEDNEVTLSPYLLGLPTQNTR